MVARRDVSLLRNSGIRRLLKRACRREQFEKYALGHSHCGRQFLRRRNAVRTEGLACRSRSAVGRPLEANRIAIRIMKIYLFHAVGRDGGPVDGNSFAAQLGVGRVDIWAREI